MLACMVHGSHYSGGGPAHDGGIVHNMASPAHRAGVVSYGKYRFISLQSLYLMDLRYIICKAHVTLKVISLYAIARHEWC